VKTRGLTHVALAVRDPQRSLAFYRAVLGVVPVYEQDDFVQAQTPGSWDVLVFERKPASAGKVGGIAHSTVRAGVVASDYSKRNIAAATSVGTAAPRNR
jgi:catechol 2,3-dioxygenase-like lactoylglutathione lyase family enzyme